VVDAGYQTGRRVSTLRCMSFFSTHAMR
jgi:hypothetical protein